MKLETSPIFPDVWIIEPQIFKDDRGFFFESFNYKKMEEKNLYCDFIQDNHSKSVKNTVRGLHFQLFPGQVKLVRCSKGRIWDVMVDIRPNSPTFKKWFGLELTEDNFIQILIPVGFAHGFSVLSDIAEVQYKVSNHYNPEIEKGILWDDPTLQIDWKVNSPVLSKRDLENPSLTEFLEKYPDPFNPEE